MSWSILFRSPSWHLHAERSSTLRVRPETSSRITELSEHKADGCEAKEGERVVVEIFPILGKPATAVEPGDCALDNPALWQNDKSLGPIATAHDLGYQARHGEGQ